MTCNITYINSFLRCLKRLHNQVARAVNDFKLRSPSQGQLGNGTVVVCGVCVLYWLNGIRFRNRVAARSTILIARITPEAEQPAA